jgi:hypothetical protein
MGTGKATFQQVNVDARFFFLTRARAPSVVERRTALVMPPDAPVREELIPAVFDLDAFDQMFSEHRAPGAWTSPPSLVVLTTVMTYEKVFGDGARIAHRQYVR